MKHSVNYNLNKPDYTDQYDLRHWNENTDIVDVVLKSLSDALSDEILNRENADSGLLTTIQNIINDALATKQNILTFDDAPTSGSNNPVKSGGVYTALAEKQDTLTFDSTPISGSTNPVTSGGVFTAMSGKQNSLVVEKLNATPDWRSITEGTSYTVDINAIKAGYTCIGVLGYDILALKANAEPAKLGVLGVYYGSANQSIFVDVVAHETTSVLYNYTRVSVYALFVKNS